MPDCLYNQRHVKQLVKADKGYHFLTSSEKTVVGRPVEQASHIFFNVKCPKNGWICSSPIFLCMAKHVRCRFVCMGQPFVTYLGAAGKKNNMGHISSDTHLLVEWCAVPAVVKPLVTLKKVVHGSRSGFFHSISNSKNQGYLPGFVIYSEKLNIKIEMF